MVSKLKTHEYPFSYGSRSLQGPKQEPSRRPLPLWCLQRQARLSHLRLHRTRHLHHLLLPLDVIMPLLKVLILVF